jgi:hypothetical protein
LKNESEEALRLSVATQMDCILRKKRLESCTTSHAARLVASS